MRGEVLLHALNKDEPIRIDDIDSPTPTSRRCGD